jgi:HEAT repeats/PBS lyase HEAT-like repeat
MDSQLRSNGSNTRPAIQTVARQAARSRVAERVERVLNAAFEGQPTATLNATAPELLAESQAVAAVLERALDQAGGGIVWHWTTQEVLRRSQLYDDLLNSLVSPNSVTRAAAARVCGAARMTEAALWIGDLLDDPNTRVRDAAVRSLSKLGGRRAVELLMGRAEKIPLYRLAIALARAASDIDVEALMRAPASEAAAIATVLACGLRRDVLRVSPLLGIAHDRRWPKQVRVAAARALAMIGDRAATDGLRRLADTDPDAEVKGAADLAYRRLVKREARK